MEPPARMVLNDRYLQPAGVCVLPGGQAVCGAALCGGGGGGGGGGEGGFAAVGAGPV
jgi:hypothetical protein